MRAGEVLGLFNHDEGLELINDAYSIAFSAKKEQRLNHNNNIKPAIKIQYDSLFDIPEI
jgi:hypothetical protein